MALPASEATVYAQETAKLDAPFVRIFEFMAVSDDLKAFLVAGSKNVHEPGERHLAKCRAMHACRDGGAEFSPKSLPQLMPAHRFPLVR